MSDYEPHPLRIQRKRTKGWRLPAGAVCVTRPGKWGNPYETAAEFRDSLLEARFHVSKGHWMAISEYRLSWAVPILHDLEQLKGKQLACWCSLETPCHADVLAELAND